MPVPGVDEADRARFLDQMRMLIDEQAALWEALHESTIVGAGFTERHGPWPAEACSWVLLRWLDAGLVAIAQRQFGAGDDEVLALDTARRVLGTPDEWRPGRVELVALLTADGEAADDERWQRAVDTV